MLLLLSHSVVSNSVQPYGQQPTRLLCPQDSLGKNTGVGCHFLLQHLKAMYIVNQLYPNLQHTHTHTHMKSKIKGMTVPKNK